MKCKNVFMMIAAAAVLAGAAGCSSLIRQKPKPVQQKKAVPAAAAVKKAPQPASLTPAQLAAMTPDQLRKYHAEKQKRAELESLKQQQQQRAQSSRPASRREDGRSFINSFMSDRPSREKRRRLGDVSRQLNYSETSIFPWRDGRRSETLMRR